MTDLDYMAERKELRKNTKIINKYRGLLRVARKDLDEGELEYLRQAFTLAMDASAQGGKKLGNITIFHSLGVARIVAEEIGLGYIPIISALLFDYIVEGTLLPDDLKNKFDDQITTIVQGLSKISQVDTQRSTHHAENLRNLLITLSKDIRVILIKVADQLYHMRNLSVLDRASQLKYSSDSFYLYAPLAHQIGLYNIKSELEDLALKYTDPDAYKLVTRKLLETKSSRDRFIREFIRPVKEELNNLNYSFDIKGRTKSVYSIWSKMKSQQVDFEEIYDLFAIRIIINKTIENEKSDCWKVYSVITDFYQPNPDRLRDWISIPKTNGYESLHTTVVVPGGRWVEVQIRTKRMNEIAEKGLAAHWKYKGAKSDSLLDNWLTLIREILENPDQNTEDIIDDLKLSTEGKEIFVFTPKGDLKKFPAGATVLDFAFDIHTGVGTTCAGAKVNGKTVPIRYQLNNGDKVEVITTKQQKPNQDWLNYVITTKAKSKIKIALKEEKLAEADNGKEILKRRFRNWKIEFEDRNINRILRHYKLNTAPDLYYLVATDKIDILEIKEFLTEKEKVVKTTKPPDKIESDDVDKMISATLRRDDYLIIDNQLDKVEYKLAKCCNPIVGDEIFGFVTVSGGISVHRVNCPNAAQMISKYGYRIVKAQWSDVDSKIYLPVTIRVTGLDDIGILTRISDVISKDLRVNMRSVSIDSTEGMFEGSITLFVKDTGHLDSLVNKITKIKGVLSVSRVEL